MIDINTFSESQHDAYNTIADFIAYPDSHDRYMSVQGLAGTGKTHVLAAVVENFNIIPLSPTAKAASVLRARTNKEVRTVHSVIYDFKGLVEDIRDKNRKQPVFHDKENSEIAGSIIGLDESSMVGTRLASNLLNTRARVIAFGDPGQLPPVMDKQFFTQATCTLVEPHRTALESGIIRQAYEIRHGNEPFTDGEEFEVTEFSDRLLVETNVVLCWKNKTRSWLNQRRRNLFGYTDKYLRAGEPIMCLANRYDIGIFNGEMYTLARDRAVGEDMWMKTPTGEIPILNPLIEDVDPLYEKLRYEEEFTPFAMAYAATVHKYQGSESKKILLINEHPRNREEYINWLYTGVTRASEKVFLINSKR
jgi:exodeoxyribonuclease-5